MEGRLLPKDRGEFQPTEGVLLGEAVGDENAGELEDEMMIWLLRACDKY